MSRHRRTYSFIRVSDHALLRFLQRAGGFDLEPLRGQIESSLKRASEAAAEIGGGNYSIQADGLTYIVRNNVVVTILDAHHKAADSAAAEAVTK